MLYFYRLHCLWNSLCGALRYSCFLHCVVRPGNARWVCNATGLHVRYHASIFLKLRNFGVRVFEDFQKTSPSPPSALGTLKWARNRRSVIFKTTKCFFVLEKTLTNLCIRCNWLRRLLVTVLVLIHTVGILFLFYLSECVMVLKTPAAVQCFFSLCFVSDSAPIVCFVNSNRRTI